MKRHLACIAALAAASLLGTRAIADVYPALSGNPEARAVLVYSALDENIALPAIKAFLKANPDLALDYRELQTIEIYDRITKETDAGKTTADVAISSAMDLQMKLANDGYARAVDLASASALPSWAIWRNTAFALTFEPAAIVYNKLAFKDQPPPKTHGELTRFLQRGGQRCLRADRHLRHRAGRRRVSLSRPRPGALPRHLGPRESDGRGRREALLQLLGHPRTRRRRTFRRSATTSSALMRRRGRRRPQPRHHPAVRLYRGDVADRPGAGGRRRPRPRSSGSSTS